MVQRTPGLGTVTHGGGAAIPGDLSAEQLREMTTRLTQLRHSRRSDKLTHENALFKRMKFAAQSERFNAEQKSLLEETLDSRPGGVASRDRAAARHQAAKAPEKQQPKRQPLPANLPRREIRHEPESTTCAAAAR
jgi:transposase